MPGWTTNHVSIESVIFGTYITYIYIFMYILCVYHSSQVLPRVFVIKLLRWIISRCILSFWPTIWESIGISIWLLPEPLELYIYIRRTHGRKQLQTTHPLLMLWLCEKYFPHIQQTCLSCMFTISELPFSPAINCPFPKYEPPLLPAVVICPVKRQLVKSRASHPWSSTSVGTLATSALYEPCFSR